MDQGRTKIFDRIASSSYLRPQNVEQPRGHTSCGIEEFQEYFFEEA